MANVIRHKRGTSNPVAGDFSQTAELLVNTTDGGLFTKTDGGSVVEIGGDKLPLSGGTLTGDLTAGLVTVSALASSSSLARQYQTFYSGSNYLVNGEYQKVVTVIPSGNSQNYQIVGRLIAPSGGSAQTVNFNALLRSNTLPDLSWTISYTEELMSTSPLITPQLWTKETTTAGFVLAFAINATIFGNVTCDFLVIPRSSTHHSNVTVNTDSTSEQPSVDTGYTARDFELNTSLNGVNITYNGNISFEGSTADAYETTLTATDPTADRTITLPDATGTVWTSGNDGSGSGLDADTLDGLDSGSFLRSDTSDTASANIYFPSTFSAEAAVQDNITNRTKSGFWQTASATTAEGWPETTNNWYHLLSSTHSNTSNYYAMQFAGSFSNNNLFYRSTGGSGSTAWVRLWHSGNDGTGSGLDADTVDGIHASSFFQANNALSATTGAFSGNVTMSGTGALKVANGTTAQRPTPATGQIRYNTTLGALESYVQGVWQVIANTALDYGLITSASDTTFDYGALS